jgi:hypothetical protein
MFVQFLTDKDLLFKGNDGGSVITALTLDMSEAGAATFNSTIAATSADLRNTSSGAETTALSLRNFAAGANTATALNFYPTQSTTRFASIVAENIDGNNNITLSFLTSSGDTPSAALTLNEDRTAAFGGSLFLTAESPSVNLTDSSTSRTLSVNVDDNNSFIRSSGVMLLQSGGAITALTLDASQYATFANGIALTDGNLVVASGHGIDFSATAGSGTSELLDDYEEGEWTPVTNNGSWTVNSAGYTKVGNMVTCQFKVTATATIASNDFTGLPFVPAAESGGVCGYQNSEAGEVFSIAVQSSNVWNFRVGSDQKGLASGALVYGAFTYQTTA